MNINTGRIEFQNRTVSYSPRSVVKQSMRFSLLLSAGILLAGCANGEHEKKEIVENETWSCTVMPVTPTATALPIAAITLTTDGNAPIVSKDDYLNGDFSITDEAPSTLNSRMAIRGRGNATWFDMPKKPYKIKLANKKLLLGMPEDKEWVLLANYADNSMLRTDIAFDLSRQVGLAYTPRSRFVEVTLNGDYIGLYQLVEQIKIAKNRVNIKELDADDTAEDVITGGYLLEIDFRKDANLCYTSKHDKLPVCLKDPDEANTEQFNYISDYFQKAEDAIYSSAFADPARGYSQYLDADSVAKWFLVNEISKNYDAQLKTSVYLYKNRGGKLFMGPVWDFDRSAGNSDARSPEGWWVRKTPLIEQLFKDPAFSSKVQTQWCALKATYFPTLQAHIDERAHGLADAAARDFSRWDFKQYLPQDPIITEKYAGEVNCLKSWLDQRVQWMDQQFTAEYGACPSPP